ncbi:hypothetical protein SAMN05660420_00622 [Desulfuromusa kysingii]|uniref:Uncharacterized protein n=1 Tax=Desulfuromusa kysingii TaxID=37625 RepID=A0A1H3WDH9_9BACT|nr:hypothetical protein SAMN05660420_00622 [Desulfuromusa kysingii]
MTSGQKQEFLVEGVW